ncbi:hypothetical protein AURDEDRAFT_178633 [Auricularia subglabra TFB-10046 SS5]|uniref:Uncharacterized protein n=1 Tax=Auricularia subglabra (strain TFB-10046 / SS5) TaxID=717982 RepID=J0WJ47_AURST|nr:hypothetical protein AURDEDRAFT_178633 [Auricularia subglabra TFB-10046 SS5]
MPRATVSRCSFRPAFHANNNRPYTVYLVEQLGFTLADLDALSAEGLLAAFVQ